jgi:hypothetical protein
VGAERFDEAWMAGQSLDSDAVIAPLLNPPQAHKGNLSVPAGPVPDWNQRMS